jgi:hypothetical protein
VGVILIGVNSKEMLAMKPISNVLISLRQMFSRPAAQPVPVVMQCNYGDDYYGDKVCVIKTDI